MASDKARQAREQWIGDEYRAQKMPMAERNAFDAGYAAGSEAMRERAVQAVADECYGHDPSVMADRMIEAIRSLE